MEVICEKIERNSFQMNEEAIAAEVKEILAEIYRSHKTPTELFNKLKGYKSAFTRGLNTANKTAFDLAPPVDDIDANYRSSLLTSRTGFERPFRIMCAIADKINETGDAAVIESASDEMTPIEKRHDAFIAKFEPVLVGVCKIIDAAERQEFLKSLKDDAKMLIDNKDAERTLTVAKDCKPNFILSMKASPYEFETWITLCSNYLLACGADRRPAKLQQSVVLPLLAVDVYERIQEDIHDETAAISYDNDHKVRIDRNANDPTIIELLAREWEDEYPLALRRKLIHELRQDNCSNAANWVRNMIKQFRIAKYREMNEDEREISITTVSLRNESLRTLIIEEIKKNTIKNMDDLLRFVKLKEGSCKESKEPANGLEQPEVFLTNYQKQKRGRLASRDQQHRNTSQGRNSSQNRAGSQGREKGREKWCSFHKVKTHWTSECFSKNKNRKNNRQTNSRTRPPTPGPRARSKSPRGQSMLIIQRENSENQKENSGNVYLTANEAIKPILDFTFQVVGQLFCVPCYADSGSSASLISLQTARLLGLKIVSAPGENIQAANGENLSIEGKACFEISFHNDNFIPICALITSDFDTSEGPINIISFSMLEKLGIIQLSHLITKNRKILRIPSPISGESAVAAKNRTLLASHPSCVPLEIPKDSDIPKTRLECPKRLDFDSMSYDALKDYLITEFKDIIRDELTEAPMKCEPFKIKLNPEKVQKFPPQPAVHVPPYPLHMAKECRAALKSLEDQHCIAELNEYETTPYLCTSLFVLKKNGSLRIVTNHDSLNCNVDRLNYPIQSPQSLLQRIPSTAKHYLICDLLKSYYQVPLDPESQILTSFLTPDTRYKWLRSPMGFSLSGDIFNLRTNQAFASKNIEMLKCVDDVCLWGKSKRELMKKAIEFLKCCSQFNIIVSKAKIQLNRKVEYLGNILDGPRISMSPSKINALLAFPLPTTIREIRSWCGLAQIFSRHTPDLAIIMRPIQKLLQKHSKIVITPEYKDAFEKAKKLISSAPILSAFDTEKLTILTTDASKDSFGYALLQVPRDQLDKYYLIKCNSKAMNKHQVNYAMCDKELEGIRWALMDCSYYLRGLKHFQVVNDHKSIETILKKNLEKIQTPRQLRCILNIRLFSFTFVYKSGKSIIMTLSDLLSRQPLFEYSNESSDDNCPIEEFRTNNISLITFSGGVNQATNRNWVLMTNDTVTKSLLQQLADETKLDKACQIIKNGIENHIKWEDLEGKDFVHAFRKIYEQISIDKLGLLVVNNQQIVCPVSMVKHICSRLHIGHPGQQRALSLARSLFWWGNQRQDVLSTCIACEACQTFMRSNPKQEISTQFPEETQVFPMSHISGDVLEVDRIKYVVNRDRYSGYIWADKVTNITSDTMIKTLDQIFMSYGYPIHFCSDNATSYTSEKFKQWASSHDINLITGSPFKSSTQGLIESANRIVRSLLNKSKNFSEFRVNIFGFNCTPRSDDSRYSPAELLLGRKIKGHLPCLPSTLEGYANQEIYAERIERKNLAYKAIGGSQLPDLQAGDLVRVQNTQTKRWDKIATVIQQITDKNIPSKSYSIKMDDGTVYRRNKKYLRLMQKADIQKNRKLESGNCSKSNAKSPELRRSKRIKNRQLTFDNTVTTIVPKF